MQTQQSIALINGLEKVLGKGSLFAYLVSMTVRMASLTCYNRAETKGGKDEIDSTRSSRYFRFTGFGIGTKRETK